MYSTCIHCNSSLDRNEVLEAFPVGKRIAFDPAKGRLWVVCRKCERWNLTPLEERWEAIEQAERRFRDSKLRVSSDNIGLARLREGLDLVRIGLPQRPEMAAWRYGDQFGRRRRRQLLMTGTAIGAAALAYGGILWAGVMTVSIGLNGGMFSTIIHGRGNKLVARVATGDGQLFDVLRTQARMSALLRADAGAPMRLRLEHNRGSAILEGPDAMRAAAQILPTVNRFGASKKLVNVAVSRLEAAGGAGAMIEQLQQASQAAEQSRFSRRRTVGWVNTQDPRPVKLGNEPGALHTMRNFDRLALEMALHEESERRAMDGELAELERAWKDAEEIAKISDDMFEKQSVNEKLGELKRMNQPDING